MTAGISKDADERSDDMCDPDELAAARLLEEYLEREYTDNPLSIGAALGRCPTTQCGNLSAAIRGNKFARENYAPLLVSSTLIDETAARIKAKADERSESCQK